jgi:hypothetical protein
LRSVSAQKEIAIRKRTAKVFNKQPDDFATLEQYNDYLEEKIWGWNWFLRMVWPQTGQGSGPREKRRSRHDSHIFENLDVQKEIAIRKRTAKVFNKQPDDFATLEQYWNWFLRMVWPQTGQGSGPREKRRSRHDSHILW